jgi:hypothetical protein
MLRVGGRSNHIEAADVFIRRIRISRFFDEQSKQRFPVQASEGVLCVDAGDSEYDVDAYSLLSG